MAIPNPKQDSNSTPMLKLLGVFNYSGPIMANVTFYEKPGCINNTKQKALRQAAGHSLDARNLLTEPWSAEQLRPFFGDRPVSEWFNKTAPAIKEGQVQPDAVDAETALALMVQDPLLIRRPLIRVGDRCEVGFDISTLDRWIGLEARDADLETCPHSARSATE